MLRQKRINLSSIYKKFLKSPDIKPNRTIAFQSLKFSFSSFVT